MEKEEILPGFKLIRIYFILLAILNLFSLFEGGLKTLMTLLVIIVIGVIVFGINKRYKFGQYVIYAVTLYSTLSALISILKALDPNTLQEFIVSNPYINDIGKVFYFSLSILLVHIAINIMIFYYTYKHRNYFVN